MERNSFVIFSQYSSFHKQRGAALLLALFALMALSHLSLQLITHSLSYSHLLRIYQGSIAHHYKLRTQITPVASDRRTCERQRLEGHSLAGFAPHSHDWFVCSKGHTPFHSNQVPTLQHLSLDYSALFTQYHACPGQRYPIPLTTFTTPKTAFTCSLNQHLGSTTIVLDNLEIQDATISSSELAGPHTLATPGSLTATHSLAVSGNTLVLAGGDLRISILRLVHSPAAEVTIISTHGDIIIEQIEGAISLLAYGRGIIAVPQTPTPRSPPLPPLRQASIAGIIPQ